MAKSIEEIKKEIEELLKYRKENYTDSSDEQNFVIPFIAMNDGHTPAQIRAQSKGIYKDIQRSPFVRKTGVFTENGTIQDIDISSLVYYGTLQQSKIAPTLENIDVKLYFREPSLTKVPDTTNSADPNTYADKYIWREAQPGFHVYNNDTVYGYEWLILQSDYVNTDGIYNLHMNIEDGLGVCKFAGTQAPISLKGVQYKIVITAKNLWNREFSLLDSMPLIKSLDTRTDDLAPSVNAVREYYEKALETLKVVTQTLLVKNSEAEVLMQDKDGGIYIKNLTLGEIENTEEFVKNLGEELEEHISQTVDNVLLDDDGKVIGVHGLVNKGAKGNLNAKFIAGATLSNGAQSVQEDVDPLSYIPFVDKFDTIGYGTTVKQYKRSSGQDPVPYYQTVLAANDTQQTLYLTRTSLRDELKSLVESVIVGATTINYRFATIDKVPTLKITSGKAENGDVTLQVATVSTDEIDFGGGFTITANRVAYWNGQSSIAYKNPHSELLNSKLRVAKKSKYAELIPNIDKDADGNLAPSVQSANINSGKDGLVVPDCEDVNAWTKLGSALQALYELPLGTYQYKRGGKEYKEQLGIFIERVNQVRDHLAELRGSGEDATGVPNPDVVVAHKRNTLLSSSVSSILNSATGDGLSDASYKLRVDNNAYTYTDEEVKSIVNYLNLLTSKDELSQEIRNTVGVLLMAAKETQERLLDVETAVYGWDAKTVPGSDEAKKEFINGQIAEALQDQLNNSPFLLGLNRLMRAILLEIYDTTDLEKIDAEIESRVTDSDTLAEKATVKSRMDQVDEIASVLYSQVSAMIKFYSENIASDESSHTYREMTSFDKATKRISAEGLTEDTSLQDAEKIRDDHSGSVDIDVDRTWKNLPAKDDVKSETKESVGFGKVADSAHKHTPNLDETGLVRVPVKAQDTDNVSEGDVDHTDVSEYVKSDENESGETRRFWDLYKLDKSKTNYKDDYAAAGTYNPFFKTKLVAWEQAKVERMNTKLSELTKTIYGTDDVSMKYPNRTEVLRRNITNLIDDLYPNRSFKIENPIKVMNDDTAEFYLPFKTSLAQNPAKDSVATPVTDESEARQHTSLLTWFDNELFNFRIGSHYIGKDIRSDTGYKGNKQITLNDLNVDFSTKNLVTDTTSFSAEYGTYAKAYSRLDMLENLLGVEDCYITNLYADNITETNPAILAQIDKWAVGYTSSDRSFELSKNITTENALIQSLTSQLESLNAQKESLQNEINSKIASNVELKNEKLVLENEPAANLEALQEAVDAAKVEYEAERAKVADAESELAEKTSLLQSAKDALTAEKNKNSGREAEINTYRATIESIEDSIQQSTAIKENNTRIQKLVAAYDPLSEAKTFEASDWLSKLFEKDNATVEDLKANLLAKTVTDKQIFENVSAYNGTAKFEEDRFNLVIDRIYEKLATSSAYATTMGGTKLVSPYTFKSYKNTSYTDYYKRTDEPNKIYLDEGLTQELSNYLIISVGDEAPRTEADVIQAETFTEVVINPTPSADSEGTENATETGDATETPTVDPIVEKVSNNDGIYRVHYTNAILVQKNTKDFTYQDNLEIIQVQNIAVYRGNIYNITGAGTVFNLTVNDLITGINFETASVSRLTDATVYDANGLEIENLNELLVISDATVVIPLVYQPVSCDLKYKITYTVNWTGAGEVPRCRTYVDLRNKLSEDSGIDTETGESSTVQTEIKDEDTVIYTTDHPYARVYEFVGKKTINFSDSVENISFEKDSELFKLSNGNYWEDLDEAISETKKDLEALQEVAEDAYKTSGTLDSLVALKADLDERISTLQDLIATSLLEPQKNVDEAQAAVTAAQEALNAINESVEQKLNLWSQKSVEYSDAKYRNENRETLIKDYEDKIELTNKEIEQLEVTLGNVEDSINAANAQKEESENRKNTYQAELDEILGGFAEKPALPYYSTELQFNDYVAIADSLDYALKLSKDIRTSSNVNYVISRKEKPLQARTTTVEAFLDSIAKGLNYGNNLRESEETYRALSDTKGTLTKNMRFESVESWKALKRVFDMTECKQSDPRIFDLDLSESWENSNYSFAEHNKKVWQLVTYSRNAKKGPFKVLNAAPQLGGYSITDVQLVVDPENLPYQDSTYLQSWSKYATDTIRVIYLQGDYNLTEAQYNSCIADKKAIYLTGKSAITALSRFYANDNTGNANNLLTGAKGWQNQTEYNIYKTLSNILNSLFNNGVLPNGSTTGLVASQNSNNLYFILMKLVHPVGSLYVSLNPNDPSRIFGGTWKRLPSGLLANVREGAVGNAGAAANDFTTTVSTWTTGGVLEGTWIASGVTNNVIGANNMPSHYHPITDKQHYHAAYMDHWHDDNNHGGNRIQTGDTAGAYYTADQEPDASIHHTDKWDYNRQSPIAKAWTGINQTEYNAGGDTPYLPRYVGMYMWIRIA